MRLLLALLLALLGAIHLLDPARALGLVGATTWADARWGTLANAVVRVPLLVVLPACRGGGWRPTSGGPTVAVLWPAARAGSMELTSGGSSGRGHEHRG